MNIGIVLSEAANFLKQSGIESPRLDAEVLLAHCLGVDRVGLYVNSHSEIEAGVRQAYWELVRRRGKGEPVAYLTGAKEFMGLEFLVTPAVLIPRPETELLVERAMSILKVSPGEGVEKKQAVVDTGTGSGAIAVSIARNLPEVEVFAVDVSGAALEVARLNARRHGVAGRITFLRGDLLLPLPEYLSGKIDLITANLPYIPCGEIEGLMPDVGLFEPRLALDGGEDGLEPYRRLIPMAEKILAPGGSLLMEIGPGQGQKLASMLEQQWRCEIVFDLAGRERLVAARWR